ncbi:hypothetical protein [Streptomyces sp. NPDC058861]|uniref:hypothetical protein n=1 Tax=Streptomyces sp. NPDC058861 TaxID=3346653 RepID=UPI003679C3CC
MTNIEIVRRDAPQPPAQTEPTPAATQPAGFFVPGALYYDGDPYKAPEQTHTFQCEHVATHPRPGAGPRAFGFVRNNAPDAPSSSAALSEDDFPKWTRISASLTEPTGNEPAMPATTPDRVYTRAEAEEAADAAFDCLRHYLPLDHRNDRRFVTQAFLAFLDNPGSPYPYASHDPDDGDGQTEHEPSRQETGDLLTHDESEDGHEECFGAHVTADGHADCDGNPL